MAIKPISLPTSAGISYGEGDVRHFSEGDAQDVPGLQNPTRYLAQRDNLLAEKLNEVVDMVNNREQIVPLPLVRTAVAPAESFTAVNYRIPEGFEARVLNAAISSTPTSASARLDIYYDDSFGATPSGDALVSTTSEFTAGTSFQNPGELIVQLTNTGDVTLEVSVSIILTMRPIGAEGSLLVGSTIKGEKGDPGPQGAPGPSGPPGTGGAGSPGMIWRSAWLSGVTYNPPDVVSFPLFGTVTSSYIALQGHVADTSNQPPNTTFWDPVAVGSSGSVVGVPGPAGPAGAGSVTTAFAAVEATLITGSDWQDSQEWDGYLTDVPPSSGVGVDLNYVAVNSATGTLAFLFGNFNVAFLGSGTIVLPSTATGAVTDFDSSSISVVATLNGSTGPSGQVMFSGTSVTCIPDFANAGSYQIRVVADTPQRVAVSVYGVQVV